MCDFHPSCEAEWFCKDCSHYLCEHCVQEKRLTRGYKAFIHDLSICKGRCVPLDEVFRLAAMVREVKPAEEKPQRPSLFLQHYESRFLLGVAVMVIAVAYMLLLRHPSTTGINRTLLYMVFVMAFWGLVKRKHWGAKILLIVVITQCVGYALFPYVGTRITFLQTQYYATGIIAACLLVFACTLPEFYKP